MGALAGKELYSHSWLTAVECFAESGAEEGLVKSEGEPKFLLSQYRSSLL